jgi:hypothetical protein
MKKIKIAKNDVWDSVLYLEGALDKKLSDFSIKFGLKLNNARDVIDHVVKSLINYQPFINGHPELFWEPYNSSPNERTLGNRIPGNP